MFLCIRGGSKTQKALAKDVVDFVKKLYMPRHNKLDICVMIRKTTSLGSKGHVECDSTRCFIIEVAKHQSLKEFIRTIIHEMVHVKQYVFKELVDVHKSNQEPKILWKDEDYTNAKYEHSPWEIEAHELEEVLYNKFMDEQH